MKKILIWTLCLLFTSNISFSQIREDSLKSENKELYGFITEWWRTPYKYGGQSKRGIDCSAFMQVLFKEIYEIKLPRVARDQYKVGKPVKKSEAMLGDLVFFRRGSSKWHVGLYLADGWFLHSGVSKGVFINNISEPAYSKIFLGIKRIG